MIIKGGSSQHAHCALDDKLNVAAKEAQTKHAKFHYSEFLLHSLFFFCNEAFQIHSRGKCFGVKMWVFGIIFLLKFNDYTSEMMAVLCS